MKPVKTILIILLTTATLAAATERPVLWSGAWLEIAEVDAETGEVYDMVDRPTGYYRYLGYDGTYFWAGHYVDVKKVGKFDKNGTIISTFIIPEGNGSLGIAYDGEYLWVNVSIVGGDNRAYHLGLDGVQIPPDDFEIDSSSRDLTWDGEYLWAVAGAGWDCYALCYDVNTGALIESFPVGDDFWETETRCIASDGTFIYTIGWEKLNDSRNAIYKYTKDGDLLEHTHVSVDGWQWGLSYWEEGITTVQPASVGRIKAIYR